MRLQELFTVDAVKLDLEAGSKDELLRELVALVGLDEKSEGILFKTLKRRENLGNRCPNNQRRIVGHGNLHSLWEVRAERLELR